jgi:hypothetical protein
VNPAQYGLVVVTSSEGRNLPYGRLEDILSRDTGKKRVICDGVLLKPLLQIVWICVGNMY